MESDILQDKIAICSINDSTKQIRETLAQHFDVKMKHCANEEELIAFAKDADGILIELQPLSSEAIQQLSKCRLIVVNSVGFDHVDVAAAREKGIVVSNMPDYCVNEVADHAVALMLALTRKVFQGSSDVRNGLWDWARLRPINALRGEVLGIVGFGRIGSAVAVRAKAFGMKVIENDPYIPPGREKAFDVESVNFRTLLMESDIVTLHVPLTRETLSMISEGELRAMKRTAYLINTSRGKVVEHEALRRALAEGWIAGAGLDVLDEEPPGHSYALFNAPNLIITPHSAFLSEQSLKEKGRKVVEEFRRVLRAESALYSVNVSNNPA
jgi:D-3-phosphoglycerate dehydrogenase